MEICEVVIIGAGPYGLAIAAHLRAAGINFRIFGEPMEFWRKQMPKGMHLKSEGFACNLYDPGSTFTLRKYCEDKGLPYGDRGNPVPLDVFCTYGMEFQNKFVPELERVRVIRVERVVEGFRLTMETGQQLPARRVVIAVGTGYYPYLPPELVGLSQEFVTHSSAHSDLDGFRGRNIAVIGAGASALDLAALMHEAGATVQVLARCPKIFFHDPPDKRYESRWYRLRRPMTGIGSGWRMMMYARLPLLFRLLPGSFRVQKVREVLGPAPGWFTRKRVEGKVALHVGVRVDAASVQSGRVQLQLLDASGNRKTLTCDHVIAATGYKTDVQRLWFLDADILAALRRVDRSPTLSSNFESTVPGLYFVGVSAANTFGPLLRFAYGAGFAASRLTKHLARRVSRTVAPGRLAGGNKSATSNRNADEVIAR